MIQGDEMAASSMNLNYGALPQFNSDNSLLIDDNFGGIFEKEDIPGATGVPGNNSEILEREESIMDRANSQN